ncbi:MAG: hypothetical protein HYX83_00185 [Chloroflexi bacterium]|nr:hypothetical protein [Chloroflexota bacterium]
MLEWVGGVPVGRWLVLGIILLPVYVMLIAWFLGKPRDLRLALRGFAILLSMIVVLWGGLFVFSMLLKFVFFSS